VTDLDLARPCGLYSKNPIGVAFTEDGQQKVATYWGRWAIPRASSGGGVCRSA
jgi:hypothetical protein